MLAPNTNNPTVILDDFSDLSIEPMEPQELPEIRAETGGGVSFSLFMLDALAPEYQRQAASDLAKAALDNSEGCREIEREDGIPKLEAASTSPNPEVRLYARIALAGIAADRTPETDLAQAQLETSIRSLLSLADEAPITQPEILKTLNIIFSTPVRLKRLPTQFFVGSVAPELLGFLSNPATDPHALISSAVLLSNIMTHHNIEEKRIDWARILLELFKHQNSTVQSAAIIALNRVAFPDRAQAQPLDTLDKLNTFFQKLIKALSPAYCAGPFTHLLTHPNPHVLAAVLATLHNVVYTERSGTAATFHRDYGRPPATTVTKIILVEGGVGKLCSILSAPLTVDNADAIKHAMSLLPSLFSQLADTDPLTRKKMVTLGCVDRLLRLLESTHSPTIQRLSVEALAHCSRYPEFCEKIMDIGRVQLHSLLKIVTEYPQDRVAINIKKNIEVVLQNINRQIVATPSIWFSEGWKAITRSSAGPGPGH